MKFAGTISSGIAVALLAAAVGYSQTPTQLPNQPTPQPNQPAVTQPGTTQPSATQPATTQPGAAQPATTQPGANQPPTTQPNASAQANVQSQANAQASLTASGKITKVQGDQVWVNANGREMSFYTSPQTHYSFDGRDAKFNDLRVGSDINVMYGQQGDRMNATAFYTGAQPAFQGSTTTTTTTTGAAGAANLTLRGKVIRTVGTDQVVVQGDNGKEMVLWVNPQSQIMYRNRAARIVDLTPGVFVNAQYVQQGDRYIVTNLNDVEGTTTVVPGGAAAAVGTEFSGTVVRVVGTDQVIVRDGSGKEVTVYVNPQTTYQIGEQPGQFTQIQPGQPVQLRYEVENGNRWRARSIIQRALNR